MTVVHALGLSTIPNTVPTRRRAERKRKQKPAAGFPAAGFESIIMMRSFPSLAGLAATYSSKP